MRIGIVVPHIFMHREILPHVIFSPGTLALELCRGLQELGADVTLFTPGPVDTPVRNVTADMSYFQQELAGRDDTYMDLLKKHPFTFITLARQVQSELVAKAYHMANDDRLDVVHIYTNEEDIALPFAQLCRKPVVFTHHDPFNFLVKYKNIFPKYRHLNWLSMSTAQRRGMPADTNWTGNIYHGLSEDVLTPVTKPTSDYIAYLGRIIEPKGTHLAIAAVKAHNAAHPDKRLTLRIAGKHYSGKKDTYWQERIAPLIDGTEIVYDGHIGGTADKREFLANAAALIMPSIFQELFGMVAIEALASGTPVIGLASGAIPEIIRDGTTGFVVAASDDEAGITDGLADAIGRLDSLERQACRDDFLERFTLRRMCAGHLDAYTKLAAGG